MVGVRQQPRTQNQREIDAWRRTTDDQASVDPATGDFILKKSPTKTVQVDYTVKYTDYRILVDASGGPVIITLPLVAGGFNEDGGQDFIIQKIDSSSNKVTVDGNGDELINGSAIFELLFQYESVQPTATDETQTGTDWLI